MTSDRQIYNVILYMMEHPIPNAKIMYLGEHVNLMFNWDQQSFDRGTGLVLSDYDHIMRVLEALAHKEQAHRELQNAMEFIHEKDREFKEF